MLSGGPGFPTYILTLVSLLECRELDFCTVLQGQSKEDWSGRVALGSCHSSCLTQYPLFWRLESTSPITTKCAWSRSQEQTDQWSIKPNILPHQQLASAACDRVYLLQLYSSSTYSFQESVQPKAIFRPFCSLAIHGLEYLIPFIFFVPNKIQWEKNLKLIWILRAFPSSGFHTAPNET